MRAAMTYAFGRLYGLGMVAWQENERAGNPSVSNVVSSYMMSLRRRKVSGNGCSYLASMLT